MRANGYVPLVCTSTTEVYVYLGVSASVLVMHTHVCMTRTVYYLLQLVNVNMINNLSVEVQSYENKLMSKCKY